MYFQATAADRPLVESHVIVVSYSIMTFAEGTYIYDVTFLYNTITSQSFVESLSIKNRFHYHKLFLK